MGAQLRSHSIVLRDDDLILRPLTERDWPLLYRWKRDPRLLYFTEFDRVAPHSLEEAQHLYRSISQRGYCFIIKSGGREIGECSLQQMNIERIAQAHANLDCRRIDIAIGERAYWAAARARR